MKKNIFISVIALIVFSFVLVQCTKENNNEINKNPKEGLTLRSDVFSIGGEVQSPSCGLDDYAPGFECEAPVSVDKTVASPNGCNVKVTMDVKKCKNSDDSERFIVFSNLQWSFVPPYSADCLSWYLDLLQSSEKDQILDEFETYIEQAFEDAYMSDYVIDNQLDCQLETESSLFFKSPCTQRCSTNPTKIGIPFFTYTTPCADDGCCVQITSYCVLDDGTVWKSGPNVDPISPCTNFHPVTCNALTIPVGNCVDEGCN